MLGRIRVFGSELRNFKGYVSRVRKLEVISYYFVRRYIGGIRIVFFF